MLKAFLITNFYFYDFQDYYIENFIPFSQTFHYLSMFSENKNPSFTTRIYHLLFKIIGIVTLTSWVK